MQRLQLVVLTVFGGFAVACSAPPSANAPQPVSAPSTALAPAAPIAPQPTMRSALISRDMGFQKVGEMFAASGVQPGQPLPELSLLDLDGKPVPRASLRSGKPLVLVTCSLTCNVARGQRAAVERVRQKWGDRVDVRLVYTVDAHPVVDDCPYTGSNWVTPGNDTDGVLVRQPTSLEQRLELARRYAKDWAGGAPVLVDRMDDAAWRALGEAPNLGLVIGANGTVIERCGWFDTAKVDAALARLLP